MIRLPIDPELPRIVDSLRKSRALILRAEPGAGKTTRVPAALLDADFLQGSEVWVVEPRRLAAKLSAIYVAESRGEKIGETVGYQFRFENVEGPRTRLRFLTEGLFLRRMASNPELKGVGCVILDEFHERHLHGDIALAAVERLRRGTRPDLAVLVMSATLDTERVSEFLSQEEKSPPALIDVAGRVFPVDVEFMGGGEPASPQSRILAPHVRRTIEKLAERPPLADVPHVLHDATLVFLPGAREIDDTARELAEFSRRHGVPIYPLYGELSREAQERALRPSDGARVILATNIAETSLTIPGVRVVIDAGFARIASSSWWSGLPALRTRPISRAAAVQRMGRAGRTARGLCVRLYSKHEFETRAAFEVPEVQRADIAQTLLEIRVLGLDRAEAPFRWFESPTPQQLGAAENLLKKIGAFDEPGQPTALGREMLALGIHPRLSRVAIYARERGFLHEASGLVAMISETRRWEAREGTDSGKGSAVEVVEHYLRRSRVISDSERRLAQQIERALSAKGSSDKLSAAELESHLSRALLSGYPDRVERDPQSQKLFIAIDAEERKGSSPHYRAIVDCHGSFSEDWLFEVEPFQIEELLLTEWDASQSRMRVEEQLRFNDVVLGKPKRIENLSALSPKLRADVGARLAAEVKRAGIAAIAEHEEVMTLLRRVRFLALYRSKWFTTFPGVEGFLAGFCSETIEMYGQASFRQLRDANFVNYIQRQQPTEVQAQGLEALVPEFFALPGRKRAPVRYPDIDDGVLAGVLTGAQPAPDQWDAKLRPKPHVESRLQDYFGLRETPKILGGSVSLVCHLLAPNGRAVQVTEDLISFFKNTYPEIRNELMRRYPRHQWPEKPG